jgi:hypothetical protein
MAEQQGVVLRSARRPRTRGAGRGWRRRAVAGPGSARAGVPPVARAGGAARARIAAERSIIRTSGNLVSHERSRQTLQAAQGSSRRPTPGQGITPIGIGAQPMDLDVLRPSALEPSDALGHRDALYVQPVGELARAGLAAPSTIRYCPDKLHSPLVATPDSQREAKGQSSRRRASAVYGRKIAFLSHWTCPATRVRHGLG